MIKKVIYVLLFSFVSSQIENISIDDIIVKMDKNLNAKSRILRSKMVVHGRRSSRIIESKNWVIGADKSFTEYLSPAREAGTKMLKLDDKLWTYSPQTDRVIQISGHMLRQSVMGSDMSYNDMMEDRPLQEIYKATITGNEKIEGSGLGLAIVSEIMNNHEGEIKIESEERVGTKVFLIFKRA